MTNKLLINASGDYLLIDDTDSVLLIDDNGVDVGSADDFFYRIKALLVNWFGGASSILDALIHGLSSGLAFFYTQYIYASNQIRLKTASGSWLDILANDFFGNSLLRARNQSDASFRKKLQLNLFRERGTRKAINDILTDLTGQSPLIVEPLNIVDTSGLGVNFFLGVNGRLGSYGMPHQALINVKRAAVAGWPNVAGLGTNQFGLQSSPYASLISLEDSGVSDNDIYQAIESVKPAGTIVWVNISA